ncbi:MAG: DMT family transporter [Alphaproteobacteria bacterium]|nr:DMT family transporter [Alphaproteobacteria bacterium]
MAETARPPAPRSRLDRRTLIAYGLLAVTMACWSGNWVVGRAVYVEIPPWGLTFWRWAAAFVILLPIAGRQFLADLPVLRREWKLLVLLAFSGTVFNQSFVYIGLRSTEAINALLLNAVAPAIFVAMSWMMLRDVISRRQAFGMGIAFIGGLVIVMRGDLAAIAELRLNAGDLWILAATVTWGFYSIFLKRVPPDLPTKSLLLAITGIALLVLAPAHAIESWAGRPMPLSGQAVMSVLYTGAIASVLAFFCWNAGVARVGPTMAGFFFFLMPVFGTVMAVFFLGEQVYTYHVIGILTVFAGIYFITTRQRGGG